MKASFIERLIAYLIDIFIVSLICSIIVSSISNNNNEKYSKEINNIMNDYVNHKIEVNEYLEKYEDIVYNMEKSNIIINSIYLVVNIAYFIVFQFMNNGCSIGKKLLHIRIIDKDKNKLRLSSMILRTFIINNIFSGLVGILLIIFSSKKVFFIGYTLSNSISNIFIIVSACMLLYGRKKIALHDYLSGSIVISDKNKEVSI